ncbi:response regulator [Aquariibacter albus]|uniref:Response regulator transcription factor n=1 Tax=Aquariibacter albus TaxID=2759899 RepID=A0A839HU25_9BURK|nr:response regulator transcription factor [Aquariibacter albus]MBB1163009.1 response regulator transcription factor [Aquariibacter albus]
MLTVYLVEDDPLIAQHVREALNQTARLRCVGHAARLEQARDELPRLRPDVLLSDLGLPDGDGTELIAELSAAPAIEGVWHPHILVFSVFGDEIRVLRAIEAGADGYFLKGCTTEELVLAVEQAARGESPISPAIARQLLKRFEGRAEPAALEAPRVAAPEPSALEADPGFDSGMGLDGPLVASRHEVTALELQVLRLVAQGFVPEEIAERVGLSARGVALEVRNVYRKLQLSQRTDRHAGR